MATQAEGPAAASWWRRKNVVGRAVSSLKTAVAAVLCLWLGQMLGLTHSYWAAISAIVVISSDDGVTLTSCRDRLIGTAIGALVGWGTFYVWHGHYLLYGLAVLMCVLVCSALELEKAGRLASVALTIIVLVQFDGSPGHAALDRFLEVSLGIVVALGVTLFRLPRRPAADTAT